MSFDIGSVGQTQSPAPARGVARSAQPASDVSETDASQEAVAVDTLSGSPPPELSDAIVAAAAAYKNLAASGRRLHFAIDPPSGRLAVELHDLSGNFLSAATPSQALEVAGGGDLS
ncbi:MAG: hypothetical protein ACLP8S_22795 [Solirubrobacteraceae bacterium]|jgi:hypothetical protein